MPHSLDLRPKIAATQAVIARYSRFVGVMRWILPLVALVLVGVVIAWPDLYKDDGKFRLLFSSARISDDGLTMENARYVGRDGHGQPFEVTALTATQDKKDVKLVYLDTIQADMMLADGTWISLSAEHGTYHQEFEILDLGGSVNIYSDRGYEFHATTAHADLGAGTVETNRPVRGQGPFGLLNANAMRAVGNGARMMFSGGVKVTIFPGIKE